MGNVEQVEPTGEGWVAVGVHPRALLAAVQRQLIGVFSLNRAPALRENPVTLAALLIAGLALALFRLMPGQTLHSFWAEDGAVFLRGAEINPWLNTLFRPYGGYMHMFPRIIAGIATLFPLRDAAGVMNILQAVVHAGCGVFAYYCLRGYVRNPVLRAIVPVAACAATVGAETADFTGGLQFTLLPMAALAVLWTPRQRLTAAAGCAFLYAACASTPFGAIPALLFLVRLPVERTRQAAWLFAAAAAGTITQAIAMLRGTRPNQVGLVSVQAKPGIGNMLERYVAHIAGQVPLGDRVANGIAFNELRTIGICVAVAFVLAALMIAALRRDPRGWLPLLALLVSFGLFAAPVYLNPPPLTSAIFSSRYDLPGGFLFVVALVLLLDVLVEEVGERGRGAWVKRTEWLALAGCGAVTASLALATVDNIQNVYAGARTDDWPANVAGAQAACAGKPAGQTVSIAESPPGWAVVLPCRVIG